MPTTTTKTLTLGPVVLGSPFPGPAPGPDDVVVGAPPQWSDGSDATYVHLARASAGVEEGLAWTEADPLDAELLSYTIHVRAKSAPGGVGPDPANVGVFFGRTTIGYDTFGENVYIPRDGAIHDVAVEGFGFGTNPLPNGASVEVGVVLGNAVTIYEVEIVVTIPAVTERATRLFPRDDALGLGSAPRIHPPPKRGRVVGGYM